MTRGKRFSNLAAFFQFNLQVPERNLNYRTQLLHSHLRQPTSESSTHLKINYNDLMPLVAGIHWKSPHKHSPQKKWEGEQSSGMGGGGPSALSRDTQNRLICLISAGAFNVDSPWLHVYTAHKLSLLQQRTFRLTSELTASKWLSVRHLLLEALLADGDREKEARLRIYTPAVTYIRVRRGGAGRGLLQLCLKGHHLGWGGGVTCPLPGGRVGRRGEAKRKSFRVLGHAVDAAAERKRLSGEL